MTSHPLGAVIPHPGITPRYHDPLTLINDGPGWKRLANEFRFDSARLGCRLNVKAGFRTNLASVPRIPFAYWLAGGTAEAAAVLHDLLYQTHLFTRADADALFLEACETDGSAVGIPPEARWRRVIMYAMLRTFGWAAYGSLAYSRQLRARIPSARSLR